MRTHTYTPGPSHTGAGTSVSYKCVCVCVRVFVERTERCQRCWMVRKAVKPFAFLVAVVYVCVFSRYQWRWLHAEYSTRCNDCECNSCRVARRFTCQQSQRRRRVWQSNISLYGHVICSRLFPDEKNLCISLYLRSDERWICRPVDTAVQEYWHQRADERHGDPPSFR